jgi:MOSC domain-containing protein YiiM
MIEAVFTGQPKLITDERGTWTSSIFRDRVAGPVQVTLHGLSGDKVAQPYHGGPGAAICVHLNDHYSFWNTQYNMNLQAGSVGENVTLSDICEDHVCVGDKVRLGSAVVQVSGPRVPCANLARRIGRSGWVKLTIQENRTGFYLRVLEPGAFQAGDPWIIEELDTNYARRMLEMTGLEAWWKEQASQKMEGQAEHWTSSMKHGG